MIKEDYKIKYNIIEFQKYISEEEVLNYYFTFFNDIKKVKIFLIKFLLQNLSEKYLIT